MIEEVENTKGSRPPEVNETDTSLMINRLSLDGNRTVTYTLIPVGLTGEPNGTPKMPLAYISGAYRSKWGKIGIFINILRARRVAIKYWQKGFSVFCPHMNTAFFNHGIEPEAFIEGCLAVIKRMHRKTDVVVLLPSWTKSEGAKLERALAKKRRLKIEYE